MTTQTMKSDKKIPKLRFGEFSGEWEEKRAGNIFENYTNKNHDSDLPLLAVTQDDGVVFRADLNLKINSSASGIANYKIIEPGNFVISLRSFQGGIEYSNIRGISSPAYTILKNKIEIISGFYKILFKKESFINELNSLIYGIRDGKQISYKDFKTLKLPFPSLSEQQKIANFLTATDNWIENLKSQKETLEKYKKGMMQKIFSQELRFKDENGEDFADWEEKKLGEVCEIYDGTHQTPKYVKKGIPFYSVEHLTSNNFSITKFISEEVFKKENKRVSLEKNDILMTRIGDIGTSRIIDWDVNASFYVSLALLKQSKEINPDFLNQSIKNVNLQKELWKRTIHVAFPKKINLGEIGKCKIFIPLLPEQKIIADFLSKIDKNIEAKSEEIEKAEKWKKGVMQGVFV